jgi:aminoglycoside phosphotransferase (APT) family kinase protein
MSVDWIDQPAPVRPGEELDSDKLGAYLQEHLGDLDGPLAIRQFPSGFSNLTYLIQAGGQELVLRRPPFGVNIKSAHDMGREYRILSHLHRVYPKVPRPLLYCQDEAALGAEFYIMERVRGIILRADMPEAMAPPPDLMARIAEAFIDNLVALHAVDYEAAGLGDLGRPAGYVQRQIEGWARRYEKARTDDIPEIERAAAWLVRHMPPEAGAALIHNDYKYNNLVLGPADWSHILAVLDWEMATLGDPLMDVGAMLGYWIDVDDPPLMQTLRYSPTALPGNPTREALVERYIQKSGRRAPDIVFYYVYGVFRLAVIIQQIHRRYKLGFTQDQRFAGLDREVRLCGQIATQAIEKQRIDRLFS